MTLPRRAAIPGCDAPSGRGRLGAMSSLPSQLTERVQTVTGIDPEMRPATKPQFGHYQSNVALRLAKTEGKSPREVATAIVEKLNKATESFHKNPEVQAKLEGKAPKKVIVVPKRIVNIVV